MGVFYAFKIVQMVPNREKHHIYFQRKFFKLAGLFDENVNW